MEFFKHSGKFNHRQAGGPCTKPTNEPKLAGFMSFSETEKRIAGENLEDYTRRETEDASSVPVLGKNLKGRNSNA